MGFDLENPGCQSKPQVDMLDSCRAQQDGKGAHASLNTVVSFLSQ